VGHDGQGRALQGTCRACSIVYRAGHPV
jgi:hypothetical protein